MKKVVFHINSLGKGGAERVVTTLAKEFARKNMDVTVATQWTAEDEYALDERVNRVHVGLTKEEEALSGKEKRRIRKERLSNYLCETKPDILYSFCRNANYRAVLSAKKADVPVVISVRSDPKIDYASLKQKCISTLLYSGCAGAVFQTEEARDFFSKKIRTNSRIILNPIHEKYLNQGICEERRKAIVSVGRFHEAKDQMLLIRAFEKIMEDYPQYCVEFYGDASEDNTIYQVKEYIKSHRLEARIRLMGGSNQLEKEIRDASIFVLSSKYEGMPNALMEAMALGLPVISTDCPCGGPRSLIEDGENGLLVQVGDEAEMATAIRKYLENPKKAEELGKKASLLGEKASAEKIAEEWIAYGEEILQRRKSKR